MRYRRQTQDNGGEPQGGGGMGVRKRRRGVAVLPSLFTLGNCLCGFASINYATRGMGEVMVEGAKVADFGNYAIAGYFIFAAMLFDMFDGFIARLTRSSSEFGADLDSLADMVSFGIAPAFLSLRLIGELLHKSGLPMGMKTLEIPGPLNDDAWGRLFWVVGAIYVSCTALRLARFNVINRHEISSHLNFRGMPSPGAAAVVASTIIFFATLYAQQHVIPFDISPGVKEALRTVFPYLLPAVLLVAALLMVSRFAYAHLINRFLRGRKKFRALVVYFLLVMLIVWQPQISALVAIYFYAISAPVTWGYRRVTGRTATPALSPTVGAAPPAAGKEGA